MLVYNVLHDYNTVYTHAKGIQSADVRRGPWQGWLWFSRSVDGNRARGKRTLLC